MSDDAEAEVPASRDGRSAKPSLTIGPARRFDRAALMELWQFRDLLAVMTSRDVRLRYRQTALGVVWVVLQPLVGATIFAFVFGRVAHLPTDGIDHFVFAYSGLLGWGLFSNTLARSAGSIVANSHLVSKIYFPRLLLPMAAAASALVDFGLGLVILFASVVIFDPQLSWQLASLALWVILLLFFGLALGAIAGAVGVRYRDIGHATPIAMQMLLYISPVAYSVTAVPSGLRKIYEINPLVSLLLGFRWSVVGAPAPDLSNLLYSVAVVLLSTLLALAWFSRLEGRFADVI